MPDFAYVLRRDMVRVRRRSIVLERIVVRAVRLFRGAVDAIRGGCASRRYGWRAAARWNERSVRGEPALEPAPRNTLRREQVADVFVGRQHADPFGAAAIVIERVRVAD